MFDYHFTKLEELDKLHLSNEQQRKQKEIELNNLKQNLAELNKRQIQNANKKKFAKETYTIKIIYSILKNDLENEEGKSDDQVETRLQLSYVVTAVSWVPSYDIRASKEDQSVALVYYAEITNRCDENWENVMICLSTSNPAEGSKPFTLNPQVISYDSPLPIYHSTDVAAKMVKSIPPPASARRSSYTINDSDSADGNSLNRSINKMQNKPFQVKSVAASTGSGDIGST